MTYSEPTFSSLQNTKEKSIQSRSVSDPPGGMSSESANTARGHVPVHSDNKRNSVNLSATLRGPHDQPDLWHLSGGEYGTSAVPQAKNEAIAPVQESLTEFDFNFAESAEIEPLQPAVFEYPNLQTWSEPMTERTANNKRCDQPANSRRSSNVSTPSMNNSVPQLPAKKGRHYSHALSSEDKQALVVGEKNHNLQSWSAQDLVDHHESRKELIPRTMNKVDKTETLASIEYDKQSAQRNALKVAPKVRGWSRLSNISIPTLANIDESAEYNPARPLSYRQATQSMVDIRASSAPALHCQSMLSPHQPEVAGPGLKRYSNANNRAASTSGKFAHSPALLPVTPPPSSPIATSSRSSSHGHSPLDQPSAFQVNPKATFDAFLAPHKSGKGEVHRESPNAQKLSPDGSPISSRRKRLGNKTSSLFSRKRGGSKLSITDTVAGIPEDSPVVETQASSTRRSSWESERS
ncbi:hypothetical protein NX059_008629 [Plenodomus lindquistii]|nr:hypothetical protein NX059_008629 [Plenodomus lindquistii]